jgi:hypothetical protein
MELALVGLEYFNISLHMVVEMTAYFVQVSAHSRVDNLVSNLTWLPAIVESGSFYDMPCNWNISDIREQDYQDFLLDAGCGDVACLKTLDNDVLFNVSLKYYAEFLPSIDGVFMQAHPVELFNDGKFLSVPLLMGGKLT